MHSRSARPHPPVPVPHHLTRCVLCAAESGSPRGAAAQRQNGRGQGRVAAQNQPFHPCPDSASAHGHRAVLTRQSERARTAQGRTQNLQRRRSCWACVGGMWILCRVMRPHPSLGSLHMLIHHNTTLGRSYSSLCISALAVSPLPWKNSPTHGFPLPHCRCQACSPIRVFMSTATQTRWVKSKRP